MDSSSENSISFDPPGADEFEITIFGPGVGECILMHLGAGDWFVIDSCCFPGSKQAAAIDYLVRLNVEPSDAIRRILATHWHDDHVKGLAQIVRRCPRALFGMSAALENRRFFQLVYEVDQLNKLVAASSTASEFAEILDHVLSTGREIASPDIFAADGTLLFRSADDRVLVQALSPSAATIVNCNIEAIATMTASGNTKTFRRFSPNDLSVVVQVTTPVLDLLLKADLENSTLPQAGWQAVLVSSLRPNRRSRVVKVGHHGSENAHNDDVWDSMVELNPLSVVTPYSRLAEPLPKQADVYRIKLKTDRLYATTWPPSMRPPKRRGVDADAANATKTRHAMNRKPGFVRVRFPPNGNSPVLNVERSGSARRM